MDDKFFSGKSGTGVKNESYVEMFNNRNISVGNLSFQSSKLLSAISPRSPIDPKIAQKEHVDVVIDSIINSSASPMCRDSESPSEVAVSCAWVASWELKKSRVFCIEIARVPQNTIT